VRTRRTEKSDTLPGPNATRFHKEEKIRRSRRRNQLRVQNNLEKIRTKGEGRPIVKITKSLQRAKSSGSTPPQV
jgi:hypothetical protein